MDIYLIRHGVAAELDNEIAEEGFRYLTIAGRNHCKVVAHKLNEMKAVFEVIISSPLVRAVQTAEVFASIMKYNGEIKTAVELMGGSSLSRFVQLIRRNSHYKSIAFFGHAPDVNTYSLGLIKERSIKDLKINFKNVSVCKINFDVKSDEGKFEWFLNPENMQITRDS
jgi:phosphohistidine phosphatase